MAQNQSDLVERNAVSQHFCGRGMAEQVSTFRRGFDPGKSQRSLHHVRHTMVREKRPKRSNVSDKNAIRRLDRKPALQILKDRIPGVLRER